jgi:hypothetical protein
VFFKAGEGEDSKEISASIEVLGSIKGVNISLIQFLIILPIFVMDLSKRE